MLEEFFPRRAHQIHPGSERLEALLGSRETFVALRQRAILIVGTNGKGTCALSLEKLLLQVGFKVGTYTSPHFIDPLERIRVGGQVVSPQIASKSRDRVLELVARRLPDASFFEITTAIALLCFQSCELDLLIIEAGLGGRLDSTNALSPLLTVLVSVGFDHMDRLGATLEAIAWEKALASRRNRPLICGDLSASARTGVERACRTTGAIAHWPNDIDGQLQRSPREAGADLVRRIIPHLKSALQDDHAPGLAVKLNTLLARPALELQRFLEDLPLPGRFDRRETFGRTLVLDNAHNPDAAHALLRQWSSSNLAHQPYQLVFGSLRSKDYKSVFSILSKPAKSCLLIHFDHEDSLGLEECTLLAQNHLDPSVSCHILSIHQLKTWFGDAQNSGTDPILVSGSFALVGEVMKELDLVP